MKLIENYYDKKLYNKYKDYSVSQLENEIQKLTKKFYDASDSNTNRFTYNRIKRELNFVRHQRDFKEKYPELASLKRVKGTGPKSKKGRSI